MKCWPQSGKIWSRVLHVFWTVVLDIQKAFSCPLQNSIWFSQTKHQGPNPGQVLRCTLCCYWQTTRPTMPANINFRHFANLPNVILTDVLNMDDITKSEARGFRKLVIFDSCIAMIKKSRKFGIWRLLNNSIGEGRFWGNFDQLQSLFWFCKRWDGGWKRRSDLQWYLNGSRLNPIQLNL